MTDKPNIYFSVVEDESIINDKIIDSNEYLSEGSYEQNFYSDDIFICNIDYYNEKYNVKELLNICDYYGLVKELKLNGCTKKRDIVNFLIMYEMDPSNSEIVIRRQNLWFYISELKNDRFMKKYVLFP
jgi:hypothetical protein